MLFSRIFLFLLWLTPIAALSQDYYSDQDPATRKNTFFIELGGNGFFYSLNYDRILLEKSRSMLNGRVGAMYVPGWDLPSRQTIGVPLELSYCRGTAPHFVEFGLGATGIYDGYSLESYSHIVEGVFIGVARIGYRYQKPLGGVFFKAGFTPLHGYMYGIRPHREGAYEQFTYPMIGLAIGYTLKAS